MSLDGEASLEVTTTSQMTTLTDNVHNNTNTVESLVTCHKIGLETSMVCVGRTSVFNDDVIKVLKNVLLMTVCAH